MSDDSLSQSYDEKSLHSINEVDSLGESASPRTRVKKRSITNLRLVYQPTICILNDSSKSGSDEKQAKHTPNSKFLSTSPNKIKKQSTLSARRMMGNVKKTDKSQIQKSSTRTSNLRYSQKGVQQTSDQAKTIERRFTMSSSISSIQ